MNRLFVGYMTGYLTATGVLRWGLRSLAFLPQPRYSVIALVGPGVAYALSRAQTGAARREQARRSAGRRRTRGGQAPAAGGGWHAERAFPA